MVKPKTGKPEGLEARIEDPAVVRGALQEMFDGEGEFPIQVEGTHNLPYFSTIKSLNWDDGYFVLKLVRPLPHELLTGAVFHFICASGEQRYEGHITFDGRDGYLQYRFRLPTFLLFSDRRTSQRFPFRPRESAYVILQDGGFPGLGMAGPLVNLSLGGFAMRVDRVLRLDTGYRIPPSTSLFERGKDFPRIRIQDLPRIHCLEVRGAAAHATHRGNEILLGVEFKSLAAEETAALQAALDVRQRMQRGGGASTRVEGGAVALRGGEGRSPLEGPPLAALEAEPEGTLLHRLRRRSALVALVMPAGQPRETLEARLRESGFHRLLVADALEELAARLQADPRRRGPNLCIVDLSVAPAGDAEPLEAVRYIEGNVAALGALSTVVLCEAVDPTLLLAQAERTRFLPPDLPEEALGTLDALLGDRED